ncbi:DUF6542 domain-containing protein [Geodermatophilus marinus]|uniref:DUF6542 domain-containing protein n=1 Tax=Geodermatophilus sp. LHW52908 TaxID=2303986 RepID=UPI0011C16916|nr:DUF6542 domain-containing protein [Geodermatophilus sp. LHW52908]
MSTADTWRDPGARSERRSGRPLAGPPVPPPGDRVARSARPPVPPPSARPDGRPRRTDLPPLPEHLARLARSRGVEPGLPGAAEPVQHSRPVQHSQPVQHSRPVPRGEHRAAARGPREAVPRDEEPRPRSRGARASGTRPAPPAPEGGSRLRGAVAVLAVFLVTLVGAAVDSFLGIGLGLVTLVTLTGSAALATAVVRRRDLVTTVVAPPLVFVAVAGVNIALAPSATFNLAAVATLMVRGFPSMALATAACLAVALVRWAARR